MNKISVFVLILASFFSIFTFTYAHVFTSDGTIKVGLHIEPADQPGVNEVSYLHFSFEDAARKLNVETCECVVTIQKDSSILFSENIQNNPHFTVTKDKLSFQYIFPEKGIYTVNVEGKPLTHDAFQSFSLSEDIRVEREAVNSSHLFHAEHFSHILIFGLGFIAAFFVLLRKEPSSKISK